MEGVKKFLSSMGFGKNEVEVYAKLVEMGTVSVLEISKGTKLHRSNIYDALRNLTSEGLVFEVKGEKKLFHARSPEGLLDYLGHKQLELKEAIKDFRDKHPHKNEDSAVKLSRGPFALRETVKSLLDAKEEILVYGIPVKAHEVIGPMLEDFHKERTKKGISMRHIYNSDSMERVKLLNKLKFTEARVFPAKYDSNVTTNIVGDRMIFFIWGDSNADVTVLEVKNSSMAEPYKQYFDVLWKKAKTV